MINKETILSVHDDKLTLAQWLEKVKDALANASATGFVVNKTGEATLTFSITFDDGTTLTSGEITLQQGESVASAAIVNGELILTLTNGQTLNAGTLYNGNLTLNGTLTISETLNANGGAVVKGGLGVVDGGLSVDENVTIGGTCEITGATSMHGDLAVDGAITGDSIIENMSGYSVSGFHESATCHYAGVVKNGNKLTIAIFATINLSADQNPGYPFRLCLVSLPSAVASVLATSSLSGVNNIVGLKQQQVFKNVGAPQDVVAQVYRFTNTLQINISPFSVALTAGTDYALRFEMTFLLSDSLA